MFVRFLHHANYCCVLVSAVVVTLQASTANAQVDARLAAADAAFRRGDHVTANRLIADEVRNCFAKQPTQIERLYSIVGMAKQWCDRSKDPSVNVAIWNAFYGSCHGPGPDRRFYRVEFALLQFRWLPELLRVTDDHAEILDDLKQLIVSYMTDFYALDSEPSISAMDKKAWLYSVHDWANALEISLQSQAGKFDIRELDEFRSEVERIDQRKLFLPRLDLRICRVLRAQNLIPELTKRLTDLEVAVIQRPSKSIGKFDQVLFYELKIWLATRHWAVSEAIDASRQAAKLCTSPWDRPTEEAERLSRAAHIEMLRARILLRIGDYQQARLALNDAKRDFAQQLLHHDRLPFRTDVNIANQLTARRLSRADAEAAIQLLLASIEADRYGKSVELSQLVRRAESVLPLTNHSAFSQTERGVLQRLVHANIGWLKLAKSELAEGDLADRDLADAEHHLDFAIQATTSKKHLGETYVNLGWLELKRGRADHAIAHFRSALDRFRTDFGQAYHRVAETLGYIARALAARAQNGDLDEARNTIELAIHLRESNVLGTMQSVLTERERLAYVLNLRSHAETPEWPGVFDTYLELAPLLHISADKQHRHVVFWKGLTSYSARLSNRTSDREDTQNLQIEIQKLSAQMAEFAVLEFRAYTSKEDGTDAIRQQRRDAKEVETKLQEVERQILAAFEGNGIPVYLPNYPTLLPNESLWDFILFRTVGGHDRYVCFVLSGSGDCRRFSLSTQNLVDRVEPFRLKTADDTESTDTLKQMAVTIAAGMPTLDSEVTYLAPDGVFQDLPFAALVDADDDSYWCEKTRFIHISYSQPPKATTPASNSDNWLIVGGVNYGKSPGGVPELAGTTKEIDDIAETLKADGKQPVLLQDGKATKVNVKSRLEATNYFHLATHGYYRPDENPDHSYFQTSGAAERLRSALVFAHFNDLLKSSNKLAASKSLLSAAEICTLDLRRMQLAVLSGCETGLGSIKAGGGLFGLRQSFLDAGAAQVISSHWKVSDGATPKLMKVLYQTLIDDASVPDALRRAQISLIKDRTMEHPCNWAAWFVLRPAPSSSGSNQALTDDRN